MRLKGTPARLQGDWSEGPERDRASAVLESSSFLVLQLAMKVHCAHGIGV